MRVSVEKVSRPGTHAACGRRAARARPAAEGRRSFSSAASSARAATCLRVLPGLRRRLPPPGGWSLSRALADGDCSIASGEAREAARAPFFVECTDTHARRFAPAYLGLYL